MATAEKTWLTEQGWAEFGSVRLLIDAGMALFLYRSPAVQ